MTTRQEGRPGTRIEEMDEGGKGEQGTDKTTSRLQAMVGQIRDLTKRVSDLEHVKEERLSTSSDKERDNGRTIRFGCGSGKT